MARTELLTALAQNSKTICIGFGEGSPGEIRIEFCAKNARSGMDESGQQPDTPCIDPAGPPILHTKLLQELEPGSYSREIPVVRSQEAGDFLCNFAYYLTLHYCNGKALFIHLPPQIETEDKDYSKQILSALGKLLAPQIPGILFP